MVWGVDVLHSTYPFNFCTTPYKAATNAPPQSDEQNFDDPPLPYNDTNTVPFFHITMKETTSYAYCTLPKTVIHPENCATKVDYEVTEDEISHCSNKLNIIILSVNT